VECGSFIQSPILDVASLAAWYDSDEYQGGNKEAGEGYINYEKNEKARRAEAVARYQNDFVDVIPVNANVYEIGCASASLLDEFKARGHRVGGCDLSPRFADVADRLYNIQVDVEDYNTIHIAPASVDMFIILGTISNLPNLIQSLKRMHVQLKPGGLVCINFPVADSLLARIYGKRFWMFTPSVMQFMTVRGMSQAAERAGFIVKDVYQDRQSPSLAKLLQHARLGFLSPIIKAMGLLELRLPIFGVPGVVFMSLQHLQPEK